MEQNNHNKANTKVATAEQMVEGTIEVLTQSFESEPLGVIHAFGCVKNFLAEIVSELGADPAKSTLVEKAVALRTMLGEDSTARLTAAKRTDPARVCKETADVASKVLERTEATPFSESNFVMLANLDWIIPALEVAGYGIEQDDPTRYVNPMAGALKEAYSLKLVLDGAPSEVGEMRFLVSQELLISRLIDCVPANCLYGYWLSLAPVTDTGKVYHEEVAKQLEKLPVEKWKHAPYANVSAPETDTDEAHHEEAAKPPVEEWTLEAYTNASVCFWEAIAETVEANSRDVVMRVLSQQATSYLKERVTSLRNYLIGIKQSWAKQATDRSSNILNNIRVLPAFPHVELSVWDLSPEAQNFETTANATAQS